MLFAIIPYALRIVVNNCTHKHAPDAHQRNDEWHRHRQWNGCGIFLGCGACGRIHAAPREHRHPFDVKGVRTVGARRIFGTREVDGANGGGLELVSTPKECLGKHGCRRGPQVRGHALLVNQADQQFLFEIESSGKISQYWTVGAPSIHALTVHSPEYLVRIFPVVFAHAGRPLEPKQRHVHECSGRSEWPQTAVDDRSPCRTALLVTLICRRVNRLIVYVMQKEFYKICRSNAKVYMTAFVCLQHECMDRRWTQTHGREGLTNQCPYTECVCSLWSQMLAIDWDLFYICSHDMRQWSKQEWGVYKWFSSVPKSGRCLCLFIGAEWARDQRLLERICRVLTNPLSHGTTSTLHGQLGMRCAHLFLNICEPAGGWMASMRRNFAPCNVNARQNLLPGFIKSWICITRKSTWFSLSRENDLNKTQAIWQ